MEPAARSVVAKFTAITKDVPIKMTSITKLECDGLNYQHWEMDFLSYVGFVPDVMEYVNGTKVESEEDWKQDFADIVNCIIHWTINRELSMSLQDIASLYMRVEELRKQFSGVSFAGRPITLKDLYTTMYDSKVSTLDQHIMLMQGKRDHLRCIGVWIADGIFGLILLNSVPSGFPDIARSFKICLLCG